MQGDARGLRFLSKPCSRRRQSSRLNDFAQMLQFGAAVTRLAAREPDVHKIMAEVANLLRPRSAYREPDLMRRVLVEMTAR
jgi:hypothetical protein